MSESNFRVWRLAHLGLGHTGPALDYLIRSFRLADRIGFHPFLGEAVFAVAVALAEAGQITLAWQLIGYGQAHYRDSPLSDRSRNGSKPASPTSRPPSTRSSATVRSQPGRALTAKASCDSCPEPRTAPSGPSPSPRGDAGVVHLQTLGRRPAPERRTTAIASTGSHA
jgi:hypothetical protein